MYGHSDRSRAARWRRSVVSFWVALTVLASPCFVICDGGGEHFAVEPVFAGCCAPSSNGAAQETKPAESADAEAGCPEDCTDTLFVADWVALDKTKRLVLDSVPLAPPPCAPGAGELDWAALRADAPVSRSASTGETEVLRL